MYVVSVSVNGGPAGPFAATVGTDPDGDDNYIVIGSSGSGRIAAFDVDYFTICCRPSLRWIVPE